MKLNKKVWLAGSLLSCLLFSGCAIFLLGAGATGGYAISKDTIEIALDKPLDKAWNASRDVIMHEGFIRLEDRNRGHIEAEVKKSQVEVDIQQITERTIRIRVKARKGYKLLPDAGLANELHNKILQKIK